MSVELHNSAALSAHKEPAGNMNTGLNGPMSPAGRFEEEIICGCRDSSHDPSIAHPEVWSLHRLLCTFPSVKLGFNKTGWIWCGLDDRLRRQTG
jgi:hypothetical protein